MEWPLKRNTEYSVSWCVTAAAMIMLGGSCYAQPATPPVVTDARPPETPINKLPLENDVPASERFVPVKLDDWVNAGAKLPLEEGRVEVEGVPFQLVNKNEANSFFLKEAGWSDWKSDPREHKATYDNVPPIRTPQQPIFNIPADDYEAVYLLAATHNSPEYSPVVSFRIGSKLNPQAAVYTQGGERGQVASRDFSARVPRFNETGGDGVVKMIPTAAGNVFLIRVPLGQAFAQDFNKSRRAFDVEITKELRLAVPATSAARFQYRPLGLPSGVHIFGLTFQRSPIQMEVTSGEAAHIFNEPQTPTFKIALRGLEGAVMPAATIEARATDFYGNVTTVAAQPVKPVANAVITLPVKTPKRGWHRLEVRLIDAAGQERLRRETSFAILAPDTRRHREESPFGTWNFHGSHFTPTDGDVLGPLLVKAGLRYGMFGSTREELQKYGIIRGNDPKSRSLEGSAAAIAKRIEDDANWGKFKRFLVFHEQYISGSNMMRTPSAFTGKEYKFNEEEEKTFQTLWDYAMQQGRDVRAVDPEIEIYFGNGYPQLLEEFLKRKFPRELLDSRGNESASFMSMPETQPLDFLGNNSSLWMDRQILDHYGYNDVPLAQCYEVGYPNTNPGNLSPETQASYIVRHGMHSLAWKIPVVRLGLLNDAGGSYYHSSWGAAGLLEAKPEMSPKPSYVAVATMTHQLDGATFSRIIPTGSSSVYAFEFKHKDESFTTVLWTLRGKRLVWLSGLTGQANVTDMMGNAHTVQGFGIIGGGQAHPPTWMVESSENPIFVKSSVPSTSMRLEPTNWPRPPESNKVIPTHVLNLPSETVAPQPDANGFIISPLDKLADWKIEQEKNTELEIYNFLNPRKKGNFEYNEVAAFEGQDRVLSVTPKLPAPGPETFHMYGVLSHATGVTIPGEPSEIGVWVNGNSGWGRVIWELEDAKGQRWISIGGEQRSGPKTWLADWMSAEEFASLKSPTQSEWNSDDSWQRSYINFDGWRYVRFPLPGNYPGEGFHWPFNNQWRCQAKDGSRGDGIVQYPLKFTKLAVTMPEKVLYGPDYRPVARPEIYLKNLTATYRPTNEVFVAE